MGSPAFSPTRTTIGSAAASLCAANARCSSTAQRSAELDDANEAMKPSPIVFSSSPPCCFSTSRVIRSCSRSTARPASSPRRRIISVCPAMSVNSIVTVPPAARRRAAGVPRRGGLPFVEKASTADIMTGSL